MNGRQLFVLVGAALSLAAFADEPAQAPQAQAQPSAESAAAAQKQKLVTQVQAQLGVPADGQMGPKTHAALKEFQQAKGLEATGQLDKPTLTAMGLGGPKSAAAGGSAPAAAERGEPSTPVGSKQSSAERTAEPKISHDAPTGETK